MISTSNRVIVTLRPHGTFLQAELGAAAKALDLAHLELLVEIARGKRKSLNLAVRAVVERRPDADADALLEFARSLRRSGRLVERDDDQPEAIAVEPLDVARVEDGEVPDGAIELRLPVACRVTGEGYELLDHDARRSLVLDAAELAALATFASPRSAADAHRLLPADVADAVDPDALASLIGRAAAFGLLRPGVVESSSDRDDTADPAVIRKAVFARQAAEQDEAEARREASTGVTRTKVVPVAFDNAPPLALGLIVAYAKVWEGGRLEEHYDFRRDWVWDDDRIETFTERPAVYLCSDYVWSHSETIEASRKVKERSPGSVVVHGGPDTPKYEGDARAYFERYPFVDVAVRGEGEQTCVELLAALADRRDGGELDLSALTDVPGLYVRVGGEVIKTPDRERIAELDVVPSPFLTGLFDAYADVPGLHVTLESNRGCPYGCTFCDWGSATKSRIRKFDLERVMGELEWCARNGILSISMADANFGIFERDVDIAARIGELKSAHGYPKAFGTSYAKNTVKHLRSIIRSMAEAGIVSQGILSLQSLDDGTLEAIRRSNIKLEKYDALALEMREAELPLTVELMMGLPGASLESFRNDLQECIDREMHARINHTAVLVNSPMNEPEYRAEHRIETSEPLGPGRTPLVVSAATFTREDYTQMNRLRMAFMLTENFGVFRLVSRFVRHELGMREIDLHECALETSTADRARWPHLANVFELVPELMTAPVSWSPVVDEMHDFLVHHVGMADDSALEAVLTAQHALLPAHGREFPLTIRLPHDVGRWYRAMVAEKSGPQRATWPERVPRLVTTGPADFVVDDPTGVVERSLGGSVEMTSLGLNWEYVSPVSRAFASQDSSDSWGMSLAESVKL